AASSSPSRRAMASALASVESPMITPRFEVYAAAGRSAAALDELHGALVGLRRLARLERSEVPPLPGLGVGLPRIEPVFARLQLANHLHLRRLTCLTVSDAPGIRWAAERSKEMVPPRSPSCTCDATAA